MGATEPLTRVLDSLDAAAIEVALPALIPETIPATMRERVVAANRRVLANDTGALDRIRCLLKGVELGDTNTATDLVTELNRLAAPLDQYAEHAIREALKIVKVHDENWVNDWVTEKLLDGMLWGEHWQPFVTSLPQPQADILIVRLATQELSYREQSGIEITVSAGATPARAAQIFAKLIEVQDTARSNRAATLAWKCFYQLRSLFRALPIEVVVSGVAQFVREILPRSPFRPQSNSRLAQRRRT